MEEFQLNLPVLLTALISLILLWCIHKIFIQRGKGLQNLPPTPSKLPIIGNMHQLGSLPHRSLHSLAKKHGPLMLLHLGSVPVLVVSSADSAREIMKTHDLIFASRPVYKAFEKLIYGCRDVTTSPYGEYWRQMKSIFVLQLLSNKRVHSFRSIREEETAAFVNKVRESSGQAVDLSAMFTEFSNDGIGRAAFGRRYSESENGKKFLRVMLDLMELLGCVNIGDFIPWLGWISCVNGFNKRLDTTAREMDEVFESMIEESLRLRATRDNHENINGSSSDETIMDILLQIYTTAGASIDRNSLKGLILDVFVGGTDTLSTALEWTMTELLRNPRVMEKLQREVRGLIVKVDDSITDDDLESMHYLKAVIKEAMRVHPPLPLLVPRIASADVQVQGFDVSAGTVVMINSWAIGRDPISWDEPEKFMPERFLNSSTDFRGLDFELIPFGAGRRGCPGITFAIVSIELVLANLVHKFEWKLTNGVEGKDLDMNESPGLTVHRAAPLLAHASPFLPP